MRTAIKSTFNFFPRKINNIPPKIIIIKFWLKHHSAVLEIIRNKKKKITLLIISELLNFKSLLIPNTFYWITHIHQFIILNRINNGINTNHHDSY